MKIAYCIAGTRHSGGMERVLANKTNWLIAHGYEIFIITTDQCGAKPYFELDNRIKCYDLGINYEENNGKSIWNKLIHYPEKQYRHKKALSQLLKKLRPDVTVSMFCNDASFMTSINDGSAKVLEIHFSRFKRLQYGREGLWRLADRWRSFSDIKTVHEFDRFVLLTEEDRQYWGNLSNMTVIPNANTAPLNKGYNSESTHVIAVGRFDYQKGFDRLVQAWHYVDRTHPDWRLDIYGDGADRKMLQALISDLNLDGKVILHPSTTDIMNRYRESSFLVMSSRYEGLPMVLIEAQANGLPVVSFDCKCGPKDIITDGKNGLLVKESDISALSEAIIKLIKDKQLRQDMSHEAIKMMCRYDEESIMAQWVGLFNQVIVKQ